MNAVQKNPDIEIQDSNSARVGHFTVIVPTRDEAANAQELVRRLGGALGPSRPGAEPVADVIVVDDSRDDTPELIRRAAEDCAVPIQVVHRDRPVGGLGGAVADGIALARGTWVAVLDGDLQHPPELLPRLVQVGEQSGADLVVASRYVPGGGSDGLSSPLRRGVSRISGLTAKLLFPGRLRGISDPMSGFFAIRRALVEPELRPDGYKILLELAVRCRPARTAQVPYVFESRFAGESKASFAEGLRFLRHLVTLRFSAPRARMLAFGLIGLSGFVPNLLVLWLLTRYAGVHYVPAEIIANQAAVAWNFLLLDTLLFHHRRTRHWSGRFGAFALVANADLVLRIPLLAVLVRYAHLNVLLGTAITLVAAFAVRFVITDRAIYVPRLPERDAEPAVADAG